jgi:hypothetical protein
LLLLNRRSGPAVETALFASELEKFRPYQSRISSTVHHQQAALQEAGNLLKRLQNERGRGAWAKKWESGEKQRKDAVTRIARAREGWVEVREGAGYGISHSNVHFGQILTITQERNPILSRFGIYGLSA